MGFSDNYLNEVSSIALSLDTTKIDRIASILADRRDRGGRLFILGAGGGAGHAGHAVNDFRKICEFESYSPTDNVSELTAWVNDEGWHAAYANWLRGCRIQAVDAVLVFSVGGGSLDPPVSTSIVNALVHAKEVGAAITGVVGRADCETTRLADACCVVAPVPQDRITPHVEGFQAIVWHLLVSHPDLTRREGHWETIARES
jgi:D-sedoheptulose 7-phosphate isomerase